MKQLLIIYPHWHPANLAGVHRPRLIGNFLPEFGWHPIVLTVKEAYFEETPDPDFARTFRDHFEVIRVDALPVPRRIRLFGDIGLRAFVSLYREALRLIRERPVDFIWIPIPSFYTAVLGRLLHDKTGTPYGIDYIDPWVRPLAPHQKRFSRAWWALQAAKILEPFAVKKAALISGVSTPYYQPVLERNFRTGGVRHVSMPYGFDLSDHQVTPGNWPLPWGREPSIRPFVYAGAYLPKSHLFIDCLFSSIANLIADGKWDPAIRLYFLGTGEYQGKSIADFALEHGLTDSVVEIRARFPFLHILHFLNQAGGILVIGSTERHYTASKTFQALLSGQPVFAVLHEQSSAVEFLAKASADRYTVKYSEAWSRYDLIRKMTSVLREFIKPRPVWTPDHSAMEAYSARVSAEKLVEKLNEIWQEQQKVRASSPSFNHCE